MPSQPARIQLPTDLSLLRKLYLQEVWQDRQTDSDLTLRASESSGKSVGVGTALSRPKYTLQIVCDTQAHVHQSEAFRGGSPTPEDPYIPDACSRHCHQPITLTQT
jgi:hypothetical protein